MNTAANAPDRETLDSIVSMVDLTTLEATDTPQRVRELARRAQQPDPDDPTCPHAAAVCVYSDRVSYVVDELRGSPVRVASVAGAFPHGRAARPVKLHEARTALAAGAVEIDMVLDRAAFLTGDHAAARDDIAQMRQLCDEFGAHLKVILETGELGTLDNVRSASWLAVKAGAHFLKTSTGKTQPAATLESTRVMLQSCVEFYSETGTVIGVKIAGGIRDTETALQYVRLVQENAREWLDADRFRIGASALLGDLIARRRMVPRS